MQVRCIRLVAGLLSMPLQHIKNYTSPTTPTPNTTSLTLLPGTASTNTCAQNA